MDRRDISHEENSLGGLLLQCILGRVGVGHQLYRVGGQSGDWLVFYVGDSELMARSSEGFNL